MRCPTCGEEFFYPSTTRESRRSPSRSAHRWSWIAGIIGLTAVLALLYTGSKKVFPSRNDRWVTISYADLVNREAVIRTGQTLGSALGSPDLRGAVQPFLDGYSYLLQDALQMLDGPDEPPYHNVVEQYPPGSRQPAWAAIMRSGRIHIVFDGREHVRAFLLGDNPEEAYRQSYSIIRHCLNRLVPTNGHSLEIEVFAYQNEYGPCELRLDTRPYRVSGRSFPSHGTPVDLAALNGFFDQQPEIAGAQISRQQGLVLIGKGGKHPSVAGSPISLADLAVAYRSVFHAGYNAAYISLDPHRDPTKATVNFGGLLEDTRDGTVVLDADERFKTITSGLDPESHQDLRQRTRRIVPSFRTVAERDLCDGTFAGKPQWIGTRFWFYPDNIEVEGDLAGTTAAVTKPRFTADAERSREDFASAAEFERKKAATLSPSIRTNIDHLNAHYDEYAAAFAEIRELSTVARLIGVAVWLQKADAKWLDLDSLLDVELPACSTVRDRAKMLAANTVRKSGRDALSPDYVAANARVTYLTPFLDRRVSDLFPSPPDLAAFVRLARGNEDIQPQEYEGEAARLWRQHRNAPARRLIASQRDLEAFSSCAADSSRGYSETAIQHLKAAIASEDSELSELEAQIDAAAGCSGLRPGRRRA